MKPEEQIGIPLETLLDDEGFKRNYFNFMQEPHGDQSLKAALTDILSQNATANRTKKESNRRKSEMGGKATAKKYKEEPTKKKMQVIELIKKYREQNTIPEHNIASSIAERLGISPSYVRRIKNELDESK